MTEKLESQLADQQKQLKHSSRQHLRKRMLRLDPLYPEFTSGPKCGIGRFFFCKVGCRDVSMATRGSLIADAIFALRNIGSVTLVTVFI